MKTLDELRTAGFDVDSAMERFMGNEELFRSFLKKLPEESSYKEMLEFIEREDVELAFDKAHRLKSILGNLSITSAYNSLYCIVETLRDGNLPSKEQISDFISMYEEYLSYVKEI